MKRSGAKMSLKALPNGPLNLPISVSSTRSTTSTGGSGGSGSGGGMVGEVFFKVRPKEFGQYCCSVWVDHEPVPASFVYLDVQPYLASATHSRMLSLPTMQHKGEEEENSSKGTKERAAQRAEERGRKRAVGTA